MNIDQVPGELVTARSIIQDTADALRNAEADMRLPEMLEGACAFLEMVLEALGINNENMAKETCP